MRRNFWDSDRLSNLISIGALGVSLVSLGISSFALFRTIERGIIDISPPSRVAIASSREVALQGNNSDKIFLSFSLYNNGATLKTIKSINLTVFDEDGEMIEFFADAQLDTIRDVEISEFPLQENDNYSLVTAISVLPRSHYIANQIFFYTCDKDWHPPEKMQFLDCEGRPDSFRIEPGVEYQVKISVDAFRDKSRDSCFSFTLPDEPQSRVFDFSPVHREISCSQVN